MTSITSTVRQRSGPGRATGSVAGIALLFPGIAVNVVAEGFPEPRRVVRDELESARPFGALPEIKMRHQQAGRAAVLGGEGPALVAGRHQGLATDEIGD